MKILTFFTDSHRELLEKYLQPSVPIGAILEAHECPQRCSGVYREGDWHNAMHDKLDLLLSEVANLDGHLFVYVDVDVMFVSKDAIANMAVALGSCDIAFQSDGASVCAGVFIARANVNTQKLFQEAKKKCSRLGDDQPAVQANLGCVKWCMLPKEFWNYGMQEGKVWDGVTVPQLPANLQLVHANWMLGVPMKKKFLDQIAQKLWLSDIIST